MVVVPLVLWRVDVIVKEVVEVKEVGVAMVVKKVLVVVP